MKATCRLRDCLVLCLTVVTISLGVLTDRSSADTSSVGIYVFETLEDTHKSMGIAGTAVAEGLRTQFAGVRVYDRIPLESNETVRILDEMTEGREIVLLPVTTFLHGTVLLPPTIRISDDAIKFKDLTWHVNQDSVITHARSNKHTHVIIGRVEGRTNTARASSSGGRALISVNVRVNLRLMDTDSGSIEWAQTLDDTRAGFDPRIVFDGLVEELTQVAVKGLRESGSSPHWEGLDGQD